MLAAAYILGWSFGGLSIAMMVPAIYALLAGESFMAMAFMNSSVGLFFLAGGLILALHQEKLSLGRRQQLLVVISIWILLPVGAALPFQLSGATKSTIDAYFEAVSAFTTTGATVFGSLAGVSESIILWRALLQWLGGLATLLTLSFIVGRFLGAELFGRDTTSIMQSAGGASRDLEHVLTAILPIYTGLTAACYLLLLVSGIPSFDALCLSFATVSTGGFMPRDGSIALYGSPAAELTLAVFMFFGAVSVVWIRALLQANTRVLARNFEPVGIAIIMLVFGFVLALLFLEGSAKRDTFAVVHSFTLGLASAASLVSTTGFAIGNQEAFTLPYLLLLPIALVGGGRYSTAGGLKYSRLATMFDLSLRELRKLLYPHSVGRNYFIDQVRDTNVRRSVWSMFAVTLVALAVIILVLSYLGMPLGPALMVAISSLGNFGPIYDMARIGNELAMAGKDAVASGAVQEFRPFVEMHTNAKLVLCLGMVVGRVEMLMVLGLFNLAFWRR